MTFNPENPNRLSDDLNHILGHTREDWEELRGQRVFITGGTGFFGCWLLESFIWANEKLDLDAQITVLTRDAAKFKVKAPHLALHHCVALHEGDVQSFGFPEGNFSHVIHAATDVSAALNLTQPMAVLDNIINGTRRVLDFSAQCNARKLLFTSSGAVYGKQPSELTYVTEDYNGAPDVTQKSAVYGEGKRLSELLCLMFARHYNFEVKLARCFTFIGPYLQLDGNYAIGNFILDGLNGKIIEIQGDGTPRRSYLYAADLAIWLWKILFNGPSERAYNVGSDVDMSIAEIADATRAAFDNRINVEIKGQAVRGAPVQRYVPSVQRAHQELGLLASIGLSEALNKTILWHQTPEKSL